MISGKMVKRRNIKRRDNEVEGDDSRSDVTLSAVENENDSGDDSDIGLREGANTLKENTNVVPPVIVSEQEGTFTDHVTDAETGNYAQGEGDTAMPAGTGDSEVTKAVKEMASVLVETIRESNQALSQNINTLLDEVQRRRPVEQMGSAQHRANNMGNRRRSRPGANRLSYSRYDNSETDDESLMQIRNRRQQHVDVVLPRETTKLPIFTGKEPWNVWFNRFTEVADRRRWSEEERLDEILPRLQGTAGEFVFGQLRREVRCNYVQLVSELNSRYRVVVTQKTYGAQFSHRNQKANESVEEYASELKRLYDKAHSNRDENTRREDLLRRFLDGLYDEKARFQVEYVKEPRDIDEAVYQVVDFQETRNRPLYNEGNGDRRGKKHARAVTYVSTEYEDSDYEGDNVEQRRKLKKNRVVRKAGNSQTSPSSKQAQDNQSDQSGSKDAVRVDGSLENTLKALQEKIESLEQQIQQKGNGNAHNRSEVTCYLCYEKGHISRNCPQKQQEGRRGQPYTNRGNANSGGYQRRGYVGNQGQDNSQAYQGARPRSSHPLNY